jgi:hypothetical protein
MSDIALPTGNLQAMTEDARLPTCLNCWGWELGDKKCVSYIGGCKKQVSRNGDEDATNKVGGRLCMTDICMYMKLMIGGYSSGPTSKEHGQ